MLDCLFMIGLAMFAAVVGLRFLDRLDVRPEQPLDALGLAIPLGLGVVALATVALGAVGLLNTGTLAAAALVGLILPGRRGVSETLRVIRGSLGFAPSRTPLDLTLSIALTVTIVGSFLTALAPVTDGDALCYHLQVPKLFLTRGGLTFEPDLHETVYPLLTEMLYLVALAFRGPIACRQIQWLLGLVFAVNVTALARPNLGSRAWWAGTIALLVPAVSNGMGAPLNDVALAAYGMAAIVALTRELDRPRTNSLVLVGVFAGLAIGVKYPALVLVGLIGVVITGRRLLLLVSSGPASCQNEPGIPDDSRLASVIRALVVLGGVTVLVGGVWYLRAWFHTGNPVYPFFRHYFGGAGLDEVLDPIKRPMPVNLWSLATSLIPLTLQPDRFDSFSHQFGPIFLLFLPALLLEKAPRRILAIVALGLAFLTICLTQRQSMRFVLITIGPMAVGVAWLLSIWAERRTVPCRILLVILMLIAGFEASLAAARARHGLGVVVGLRTSEQYLMQREPTYRVGQWIANHLEPDARIVGQDHRGYYIPCDYTMELAHRRRTKLGQQGETAAQVVAALRHRGFTHVMLCPPIPERAVEFDPTLNRLLEDWLATRIPIFREDLGDADNVVRRYAIYELDDDGVALRTAKVQQ